MRHELVIDWMLHVCNFSNNVTSTGDADARLRPHTTVFPVSSQLVGWWPLYLGLVPSGYETQQPWELLSYLQAAWGQESKF